MEDKKPWYKSKIALLGIALAITAVTAYGTGWLSMQVTPAQLAVVQDQFPEIAAAIKAAAQTGNIFAALSGVAGALISVWRIWFTSAKIG